MKLRDLFKAFRHHEHESRCHELTDQERLEAVKHVDELLLSSQSLQALGQIQRSTKHQLSYSITAKPTICEYCSAPPYQRPEKTSAQRVHRSYDQAPSLASNFSRAKWQPWVQNLPKRWKNCNLQFLVNYTKYYTFDIFAYKSLIYKGFWRAWLSVNP